MPDFGGPAEEAAIPVPVEQALSNAGRFPEDVTAEVATPRPVPRLPARKPEVPPAALATAQAPEADPDALVGLDFARTTALLGDPALLIEEPPAKIWAYNGANCVLHVFFYPKVGGSDFRVLTYEVKGGPESPAATAGEPAQTDEAKSFARLCLSELLAQAEAGRAGQATRPAQPADGAAGGGS